MQRFGDWILSLSSGPDTGTSSLVGAQMSRFCLMMGKKIQSPNRCVLTKRGWWIMSTNAVTV
jgi:hypothetical protein